MKTQEMASFSERLRAAVKAAGGVALISQQAEVPKRTLETYLSGQTEPKVSKIIAIAESCGVGVEWLMTGDGGQDSEGFLGRSVDSEWSAIPLFDSQEQVSGETVAFNPQKTAQLDAALSDKLRDFRYLTSIKFRQPSLHKFGLHHEQVVAIRVSGNAMAPMVMDNDTVLLDASNHAMLADDVHVFVIAGQLLVRRLQFLPDGRSLLSADHDRLTPIEIGSQAELKEYWIGKVVWVGRWLISA